MNSCGTNPILQQICLDLQKDPHLYSKSSWHGRVLRRKGNVVVVQDPKLRKKLFGLFHSEDVGGYSGVHTTRQRILELVYLKGLSKYVKRWVKECAICQICKYDSLAYPSLLQPLPVPDRTWVGVSLDFVESLPSSKGEDTIFVVVDRLIINGYFLAYLILLLYSLWLSSI